MKSATMYDSGDHIDMAMSAIYLAIVEEGLPRALAMAERAERWASACVEYWEGREWFDGDADAHLRTWRSVRLEAGTVVEALWRACAHFRINPWEARPPVRRAGVDEMVED